MTPSVFRLAVVLLAAAATPQVLAAQATTSLRARSDSLLPAVDFNSRGIVFNGTDGFSYFALRFRVQQWAFFSSDDDQDGIATSQMAIRRARLRFESVMWDPRFKVNVQFSFSRGDMDFENSGIPNILRDATVSWQATPNFSLMGGQTKLPGNRQRVISSGDQQFPDRSIVNGAFTIDRDMGVWATYTRGLQTRPVVLRAAITSGEGRAVSTGNAGLAYTGRVEMHPLGAFTGGGDNFEGDLAREKSPRLALGVTYSHNEQGERAGGQLGRFLFAPRDMQVALADLLFKYNGFAFSTELARRQARDPITSDGVDTRAILTGTGVTAQASYLFPSNVEIGVRASVVDPHRDVGSEFARQQQKSVVLSRYLHGHRVKLQGELIRDDFRERVFGARSGGWTVRTSFEFGI